MLVYLQPRMVYLPVETLPRVTVLCSRFDCNSCQQKEHLELLRTVTLTTCTLRRSYCGGMNQRLT